ncbi:retrovirus-related pol polyprotein from transposon TNT 1-94 [Tanacetum coccineum]
MSNVAPQHYNSQSSTNPSPIYVPPHFANNSQLDSGLSSTDNLIENLINTLALLTQSYKTYLPQTNDQLRTSSNPRNQATVQDGRVVVQNVQGRHNRGHGQARQVKCYNYNGIGHISRNCTQPKRPWNSEYSKDKMLLMQAQENGVALDEEQLLFLTGGQDNAVDEDVDEPPVQDLVLNVDNVFQADDCDAFDSDVDEAPIAQTMFMANLSFADPVYDEAGSSYDSNILSEYVKDNAVPVVQSNVSSVTNDAYMMIYNDMCESHAQSLSKTTQNVVVDNSLTAELETYKEQVELYERQARFELTEREQKIDEQLRIVIIDRNIKEENLKKELHYVKLQLASTINHNKSMVEEVTSLKKDFKQKENKYLEEFLDMKALKEKVEDRLYKQDKSLQTVHMLCKPKPYYNELNKVAIGYKNPLCITRAKQVQPALYNGYEIVKKNHVPAIVHNTEDTLEIAEITRRKMHDKMKDPECVTHKMKAKALKEQTSASRPTKALIVYPPNTPATLVPRVLPIKRESGFEQTKAWYLTEVIPFFKTLKEHFEGIQKALTKEVKEMKEIFEELEAKVDQHVVDRKHDEIEWKNLLIENDNLIVDCLFKDVFHVATNSELNVSSFTEMHDAHTSLKARCLELEVELSNLRDKIQKDNHDELIKWFSNLEVNHLNLQLKYQNLKESFNNNTSPPTRYVPDFDSVFVIEKMKASIQGKDNAIKKLRMQISQLNETRSEADRTLDFRTLDFQITQLTEKINVLQEQNELFRAENGKIKQHYKELYDSIKITRAKHLEQTTALLTENESLKVQIQNKLSCVNKDHVKPKVLAPGKYAIDVEPIPPRNRNNREVHLVYLKHLKESVETLREIVEEAKVERPLDSSLASACRYTKHSQELLEYVIGTCPKALNTRDNKHASTSLPKKKQVTFEEQCAMSKSNTHKPVEQLNCQKTNVPVPPSTGVNSCTDASGSQPRSNTKKNRILPAKSVNMKKVEEHPRTIKSSLKTTNRVDSSISSKRTVINSNSHSVCQTCNKCLISANHDMCVVTYLHSVNASPSVKNVVRKVKQVWKPKQVKQVVQIVLWYLDSGCSKHMTGDRSRLKNFMKKFIGMVRFGNDHFGAIMGYGDYVIGESVISRVYYVEGLGHNLFSVGQFCNSDLEVAFKKNSCYVRDTDDIELIKGSRGSNLYIISVEDMLKSYAICLLSKASKNKSWLWHQRLNHLNFDTINDLARKDLV